MPGKPNPGGNRIKITSSRSVFIKALMASSCIAIRLYVPVINTTKQNDCRVNIAVYISS